MAAPPKKWIVRDSVGRIYGPFEKEKIRDLLAKGYLTGEEESAVYPGGDWTKMSSVGELYDIVLDALSVEVARTTKAQGIHPSQKKTVVKPKLQKDSPSRPSVAKDTKTTIELPKKLPEEFKEKEEEPRPKLHVAPPTIELKERTVLAKKSNLKGNIVPLLLVIAALGLFYYANKIKGGVGHRTAISLLVPHIKSQGSAEKAEGYYAEGLRYFNKDTTGDYVTAEENFLRAVEERPQYVDALLMLILTDYELWPLTKQDSSDQSVLQGLLQLLSQNDVQGNKRELASASIELALGHEDLARSQVDSALAKQPAEGFLYELKGQTFFDQKDYGQAMSYFEKAATLLPRWAKPFYSLGAASSRLGQGAAAQQYLVSALKLNPNHWGSHLELGVVESRFFNHDDKAKEFLTVALDSDSRLPPPIEVRGRVVLAQIYARAGDMDRAKKQAYLASELNPTDPDVTDVLHQLGTRGAAPNSAVTSGSDREHLALGDQYMRTGNYLGAQAQYKEAYRANPQNARAAMKVAEALWKLHQASEAMDYLQKSIGADPKFVESYVRLADYKSQRFDFDGAVRSLDMAFKKNSKSYEVYRGYAQVEFRRGNIDLAEKDVAKALQLYEIDLESNILMAKILLAKKDFIKSLQYAKKAVDIDRGDAQAQVNYAHVLSAYQSIKSGVEYLRSLIDIYPAEVDLRLGLAEILIQDEQYTIAEQILKQVLAASESNKEAYLLLGNAQYGRNDINSSLNSYFSAARLDPSDPSALFRAADVYLKANRLAEAVKQLQLVLRINNLYPRVHYNLARGYFGEGLTEDALRELEEEKKLNPKLADPYEFSGDILLASRKFMPAIKEYQKATEFRPLGAGLYVKLAKAYRGQGAYDESMAMLRIAAAKESGNSEIYKEYGYIYEAKGMDKEALASFERYLSLEPNAPDKDAINEKISSLK